MRGEASHPEGQPNGLVCPKSDDAHATACAEIAAIRASKQRIEEAEKRAEHKLHTASSKVQAHARGKQVRQQKAKLEKGAVVLQRGLRRLRQRWQQGKTLDFAAAVRAVSGRRKDWALEFQACAGPKGLDASGFARASIGRASSHGFAIAALRLLLPKQVTYSAHLAI
ncbi:unnamed protein product [Effrenium voratum]|nr:unnamed protein product [Effrenium voratum]